MFGLSPVNASSEAHKKMPELPPDLRCCHWATISKFLYGLTDRITPTGFPVQWTKPSFQVQVSGSQLTFWKSFSVRSTQPGPSPSMNAFGAGFSSTNAEWATIEQNTVGMSKQMTERRIGS